MVYAGCNAGMRIDHITGLIVETLDLGCICRLIGITADKICHARTHLVGNRIFAILRKLFHAFLGLLRIAAGGEINQTFQVAGNQNIHRRGRGQDEWTVLVIYACLKEVIQNFIVIGRADQLVDRHTHLFCKISR